MATSIAYGGIKFLIFVLVVISGVCLMTGHSATAETTRWKCFGEATILWFIIIALASIE